jgi:hypothetical protein
VDTNEIDVVDADLDNADKAQRGMTQRHPFREV